MSQSPKKFIVRTREPKGQRSDYDRHDIKKYLRGHDIDTKKKSVRIQRGGYSKAIRITLNNLEINLDEVRDLVSREYETVRYCERTHEILMGANTYVFVSYDYNLLESMKVRV